MEQVNISNIDSDICYEVTRLVSCTFEELIQKLPDYSWAQVFAAVDRLSREGTVTLSRASCFGYVVSLGPLPPTPQPLRAWNRHASVNGASSKLEQPRMPE